MKKVVIAAFIMCFAFISGAFAEEFSADQNASVSGMTFTSKIYFKDFKTSRTEAMGMVIITKDSAAYQLFESKKQYVVLDTEEAQEQNPLANADDFEDFIDKNGMKKVGKETVKGYKCDVYEGSFMMEEDQPPMAMKFWYSTKLEYPVKTEMQLPAPMSVTSVSTLENIKTGKQPASLFEIPSGYTEAASMQEAMGLGGFMMPGGEGDEGGSGEMPSEEDMNQMMQMLQEMVGGE